MGIGSQSERDAELPACLPVQYRDNMYTTYSSVLARPGHVLSGQKRHDGTPACLYECKRLYHVAQQYSAFMFVSPAPAHAYSHARAEGKAGKSKIHEAERVLPPPRNPTILSAKLSGLLGWPAHRVGIICEFTHQLYRSVRNVSQSLF